MYKYLLFLLILISCDSVQQTDSSIQAEKDTLVDNNIINTISSELQGCYKASSDVDSALLKINVKGNAVNGELSYNFFEKDKNSGLFEGVIQDSLIIADYTFQSEGVVSVREVVFKVKGNLLIEGYGDISMVGDTVRFKDKTRLNYHEDRPFKKSTCK